MNEIMRQFQTTINSVPRGETEERSLDNGSFKKVRESVDAATGDNFVLFSQNPGLEESSGEKSASRKGSQRFPFLAI